jgi:hypothetical protein
MNMTQTALRAGQIGIYPPDEDAKALLGGVPGTRMTPGVVTALDGPTLAGPEAAGALTLLHTTFAHHSGAQRGYRNFAAIKDDFRDRPGFSAMADVQRRPAQLRTRTLAHHR